MKISVDHIIEMVTREVVSELERMGIVVNGSQGSQRSRDSEVHPPLEIDMSGYRTPVLTEARLKRMNPLVHEIIIPETTVFTPGARDYIRRNSLIINYKS